MAPKRAALKRPSSVAIGHAIQPISKKRPNGTGLCARCLQPKIGTCTVPHPPHAREMLSQCHGANVSMEAGCAACKQTYSLKGTSMRDLQPTGSTLPCFSGPHCDELPSTDDRRVLPDRAYIELFSVSQAQLVGLDKGVEHLRMRDDHSGDRCPVLTWRALAFPNLMSLSIHGIELKALDLGPELPLLRKLDFDGGETVPLLQLRLPNLKELTLGFVGSSNEEMRGILKGCPMLEHLHSYKNRGIDGTLTVAHDKLRYLSLPRAEMLRVLKVFAPLDTLILNGCFDLHRVELLAAFNRKQLANAPAVKVDITNCSCGEYGIVDPLGRVSEVEGNDSNSDFN